MPLMPDGSSINRRDVQQGNVQSTALGTRVVVDRLTKRYGTIHAVEDVSLDIAPGEFVSLVGPSGSGKTTTMMAIAGFIDGVAGDIWLGERNITHLPPHRRDIGVVFQHLALFPHMTVAENVAFPLRLRGCSRAEIRRRVDEVLDLVQLGGMHGRLPAELSGGQQQRVAFARAVIFGPKLLLLDEPLAALDKKLRESMQRELRLLHRRLGITIIHVTHDQMEALTVSDRIVVMHYGRVVQSGTPAEIYGSPSTEFVADFIGDSTFLPGTVVQCDGDDAVVRTAGGLVCRVSDPAVMAIGSAVTLVLRPEHVRIGMPIDSAHNHAQGSVREAVFQGDRLRCEIALDTGESLIALLPTQRRGSGPAPGERVVAGWRPSDVLLLHREVR
jgi:putative spermidine/putrescine transport system ATP-binding protein